MKKLTTYRPHQSNTGIKINIDTEQIYGFVYDDNHFLFNNQRVMIILKRLCDYDEVYDFVKEYDKSGKWLTHYQNLFGYEDGTYLENMFFNIRRRYNKQFKNFYEYDKIIERQQY